MPHRSSARLLAPLALAVAALALILVISSSGSDSSSRSSSSTAASNTRAGGAKSKAVARANPRKPRAKSRSYVVQANDTLSTIAARTKVSLATLQELNPNVDPQGLHAGQKLRIK